MRQGAVRLAAYQAPMVEDFLELDCSLTPLARSQVCDASQVCREEPYSSLIKGRALQSLDAGRCIAFAERDYTANHRYVFESHDRVVGPALAQVIGYLLRPRCFPRKSERQCRWILHTKKIRGKPQRLSR